MALRVSYSTALESLVIEYGFPHDNAERILEIAQRVGPKSAVMNNHFITVTYCAGYSMASGERLFTIEESNRRNKLGKVAQPADNGYNESRIRTSIPMERTIMAPRGRTAKAAPAAPEPANLEEEEDLSIYLEKPFSPTMVDFITWAEDTFGPLGAIEPARLLVLGITSYKEFQVSDFNRSQKEARRAAKAAGNGAAEAEAEAETPAAAATPRRRGRPAAAASAEATPTPKPARRGRPKAAATAGTAAY